MEKKLNMFDLCPLFTNEAVAFDFAVQNNVIYNRMECDRCEIEMVLYKDLHRKGQCYWKCPKCGSSCSIFKYSIFSFSNLPLNKVFHLLYCWAHKFSVNQTAHEVNVSCNTVSFYFIQFRNACIDYLIEMPDKLIGGPGKTVEIDETLMCRRKYHRGRLLLDVWIFGGVCREDKQVFAVVVKNRQSDTLWKEILQHIAPGTTIMSDSWGGYCVIDKQKNPIFYHFCVNHSKNFVDPKTGAHTQYIERLWKKLKRTNLRYEGIPRDQVPSHLAEFIWRNNSIIIQKKGS